MTGFSEIKSNLLFKASFKRLCYHATKRNSKNLKKEISLVHLHLANLRCIGLNGSKITHRYRV